MVTVVNDIKDLFDTAAVDHSQLNQMGRCISFYFQFQPQNLSNLKVAYPQSQPFSSYQSSCWSQHEALLQHDWSELITEWNASSWKQNWKFLPNLYGTHKIWESMRKLTVMEGAEDAWLP